VVAPLVAGELEDLGGRALAGGCVKVQASRVAHNQSSSRFVERRFERGMSRSVFAERTRCSTTRARTGTLHLAHGEVQTPAFVPLATKGVVKTLEPRDVEALGYELILGNTFHLLLSPGPELVARLGGLNEFMRWPRPIITDSGGFQVFSMGHGTVADEIKGRGRPAEQHRDGAILSIDEDGVRFRSYTDGGVRFLGPEGSMEVQAALHSDVALVFDECTPFHVTREYTARSTDRTHRWLARCLRWHEQHGPRDQAVYGIVQGGVEPDLRRESAAAVAASACDGIAIGGTLGRDKPQMYEVVSWATAELERLAPARPRHLLGIGDIDDLITCVGHGIDTFDCAMPTRLARHGMALVPDPAGRWRVDLAKSVWRDSAEPILDGCRCPACAAGYTRAYVSYLLHAREQTALRLLTIHNLSFVARLMSDLRAGIDSGRFEQVAAAFRAGAAPG
jgi:queuine tRNA-ribosyltransferase